MTYIYISPINRDQLLTAQFSGVSAPRNTWDAWWNHRP